MQAACISSSITLTLLHGCTSVIPTYGLGVIIDFFVGYFRCLVSKLFLLVLVISRRITSVGFSRSSFSRFRRVFVGSPFSTTENTNFSRLSAHISTWTEQKIRCKKDIMFWPQDWLGNKKKGDDQPPRVHLKIDVLLIRFFFLCGYLNK